MTRARHAIRAACLGLALAASLVSANPAHPAAPSDDGRDSRIGLSLDGKHWHDELTTPLFDPDVRWVPGDVRTARFWVRNQADDAGDLRIDLRRVADDRLLATGWLVVSARSGSGPWTHVSGKTRALVDDELAPGRTVPVRLRVGLAPQAPNDTQVLATDLDLQVTLTDSRAGGQHGPNGPGGAGQDPGALPDTGFAAPWWLGPLGFLLVATGSWLVVAARRRTRSDPDLPTPLEGALS